MNSFSSTSEQGRIAEAAASIRAETNIGKLLQEAGKLKPQDMERVLKLQQEENLRFGEAAQKLGLVTEADIQQALSHQFEYPYIPAAEASLSPELTAATAPYSKEAEALRSVRSELLLRWFKDGHKTLAIGIRHSGGACAVAAGPYHQAVPYPERADSGFAAAQPGRTAGASCLRRAALRP